MKHGTENKKNDVISGTQEWYAKAGRNPFPEGGFTPELMNRIQHAADGRAAEKWSRRYGIQLRLTGLAAVLLLGALLWPFGEPGSSQFNSSPTAALPQSAGASVSASAASPNYNPPIGSAEFEIGGQKVFMPLQLNLNKKLAYAVETSQGIIWSPPPPIVDYLRPKYTHNTEPYSLYLTPRGQSELSAKTAKKIHTFPLYAGNAQSFYSLDGLFGAGDYVLMMNSTRYIGEARLPSELKLSVINLKEAAAGKSVVPLDLLTWQSDQREYKSFIAVNPQEEEVLQLYYTENGNGGYTAHNWLYDLKTGEKQMLEGSISMNEQVTDAVIFTRFEDSDLDTFKKRKLLTVHYEVQGEERVTEITLPTGEQWYLDWWKEEYGIDYSTVN